MDQGAMDRPQPSSGHRGKRPGNQGHGHDRRSRYYGPIHGCVSREAAGRHRSRKEDRDVHPGRQARLDRMGIYVWGVECRDSSDSSGSEVRSGGSHEVQQLAVLSDSQQALRAIQAGNEARTGRALLSKIAESKEALSKAGIDLRFRWCPGHEGIVGNEEADDAAREASSHTDKPTAPALERVREVSGVIRLINRDRSDDPNPFDTTRLPGQ
jgi:hypothetical protein